MNFCKQCNRPMQNGGTVCNWCIRSERGKRERRNNLDVYSVKAFDPNAEKWDDMLNAQKTDGSYWTQESDILEHFADMPLSRHYMYALFRNNEFVKDVTYFMR